MKKFLSLVLALVMTMSLVTVSAGAKDFTDDDKITYDEAVNVISEIGVVDGYTDGKFNPQGELTRGAAAKIICNLILGPTTAAELSADTAPFKDVPINHTFAGYIAYCAKEGIISGYGDGSFRPSAPLTGYAFMKMLLGALGYDATTEGYTGANWSINVAKQALGIGLNDGLEGEFNGVKNVNREEACLYALNTLQATMVEYVQKTTVNVGGAAVVLQGAAQDVSWGTGLKNDDHIEEDGFVQFAEKHFTKLVKKDDTDDFMRPSHTWTYDKVELGTYVNKDELVETFTEGLSGREAYDLLGSAVIRDNTLEYFVDGASDNGITKALMVRSNEKDLGDTDDGVLTEIYLDTDDDVLTIVSIHTWLAEATADYSESKEYAPLKVHTGKKETASYNVDVEDVKNIVDVKDEAFYLVNITYKNSNRGEVVIVNPAEVLEDSTVTKFSANNKGDGGTTSRVTKLTTGGTEYKRNACAYYDADILTEYDENLLTDNTYNVYLDQYGYFIGVDLFDGNKNYVFITGYDRPTSNLSVKTADAAGIFLDGTMDEIKVNVKDTNENIKDAQALTYGNPEYFAQWSDANSGEYAHNRWYTYTVSDSGVYTLKPAVRMTATDYTADTTINTANLRVKDNVTDGKQNAVYGEDASIFLTVDLDEVDTTLLLPTTKRAITDCTAVYTGVQSVDLEIDAGTAAEEAEVYTVYDSDYFIIGAIVVGEGKGNAANIAWLIDGAKSESYIDGTYYWEFECVIDGEVKTLTAKSKYLDTIRALRNDADGIVELRFDGDYVVNVKDVDDIYNVYTWKNIDDYDVYDIRNANELNLQGRTLYVTDNQADEGLALTSDCKAVTRQTENNKTKNTEFTSVSSAVSHLADADPKTVGLQFKGRIIAALNSNGAAEWILFINDTPLTTGNQGTETVSKGGVTANATTNAFGYTNIAFTVTRPEYVPASATVDFNYDVYVNGVLAAADVPLTTPIVGGSNRTVEGGFYVSDPSDKVTVDIDEDSITYSDVKVKYVDENGKDLVKAGLVDNETATVTTAAAGSALRFDLITTDVATKISYRTTGVDENSQGYQVNAAAFTNNATVNKGWNNVTAAGNDYVTVILSGWNNLVETYTVETFNGKALGGAAGISKDYAGLGSTLTFNVTATKSTAINADEVVAVTVAPQGSLAAATATGAVVTLKVGSETFAFTYVNDGTTTPAAITKPVTVNSDLKVELVSVTAIKAPTIKSISVNDVDKNGYLSVLAGAPDTITVTFSEKVDATAAPAITGAGAVTFGTGILAADGLSATYAVTGAAADADTAYTATIAANAIKSDATGVSNGAAITLNIKGLTIA